MPLTGLTAEQYRRNLVEELKRQEGLLDKPLEDAFLAVPRHVFLPEEALSRAYSDDAIAIKRDSDGSVLSSVSQPSMIALMLRQLRLRSGDNVLEIGAGAGYNAALMQHIVGEDGTVTTIELDNQLAEQAAANLQKVRLGATVNVVNADGAMGYAPRASYDRIIATVALWDIPPVWVKQLKPDGLLVAPIWIENMQVSAAFVVQPDGTLYSRQNIPCGFISIRGMSAVPNLSRHVSGSTLMLHSNDFRRIDSAALQLLLSEDMEITNLGQPLSYREYWRGFLPFLTLNTPENYVFALYTLGENQQAFGLREHGFALIGRGSACFVEYGMKGEVHCYGGADAFFALSEALERWTQAGSPTSDRLRLQLLPKDDSEPSAVVERANSKIYSRQQHDLRVWLEL